MSADCFTADLQTLAQAKQQIDSLISTVAETAQCHVEDCLGQVLAKNIVSPIDVPGFDNSAMDGFAFNSRDFDSVSHFRQVGKSLAGQPFEGKLGSGECVRIMTGAAVPLGADCVQMQENTKVSEQGVSLLKQASVGQAIRKAGEDIQKGAIVLHKGRVIKACDVGLIASLGIAQVYVYKPVKVAIFSTGDELLAPGDTYQRAAIYDSNRPAIKALLSKLHCQVIDLGRVPDNKQSIKTVLMKADELADCVITSGGVSVGEADFVKEVVNEIGHVDFWKIAIKPGKPLAFGKLPSSVFIGLPGNPVSAFVTFHKIAADAIRKLAGASISPPVLIPAMAGQDIRKRPGRTDFQRGRYFLNDGNLCVNIEKAQGSGVFSSFYSSNCFVVLEQERGHVSKGEVVMIEPFDGLLQ